MTFGAAAGDAGRANERTALAWQRTALSLMVGAAIMARLTWSIGTPALVPLAVAAALAVWVFAESRGRYAHAAGLNRRPRPRGGRAPTALTVALVLLAGTELVVLWL